MAFVDPVSAGVRSGDAEERTPVALVSGSEISVGEFRARYTPYLLRSGLPDSPHLRSNFLNGLIDDVLLSAEAMASGIEEDAAYKHREDMVRRKLLIRLYTRHSIYDTLRVSEGEVEDMLIRANTTLQARHLYARSRKEADRLYERLEHGESFDDLAREVFGDSVLAARGGSLGTFTFDEMDPAFEDAAFALRIGEISRPVRTAQGYSIIQLQDRFTHPLLSEHEFARRRASLYGHVLDRKRLLARRDFLHQLVDEIEIVFERKQLADLTRQIIGGHLSPGPEEMDVWLDLPLLSFADEGTGRQVWSIRDFRDQAALTDPRHRSQVRSRQDLIDFAEGVVARHVLAVRAQEHGLQDDPLFEEAVRHEMEIWIAQRTRKEIASQSHPDAPDAKAALNRHLRQLRAAAEITVRRDLLATLPLVPEAAQ